MDNTYYELSIIIPYHNEEFNLIQRAISCITFQTCILTEIILIDDGSEHELRDRVIAHIEKIPDIKHFSQEPRGVSAARNKGIQVATGEYISFLDADDCFTDDFFKDLKIAFMQNPDFILGGTKIVNRVVQEESRLNGKLNYYTGKEELQMWKNRLYGKQYYFSKEEKVYLNVGVAAKAVKSSIAKKHAVNEKIHISEDCLWNQQIFSDIESVVVVERLWYYYTRNSLSVTHRYNPDIIDWTRESLLAASEVMRLDNKLEAAAYAYRIICLLRYISRLYLNHPENKMGLKERVTLEKIVYSEKPWNYLLEYKNDGENNRKLIFLYKCKILFEYWRIKTYLWETIRGLRHFACSKRNTV